MVAAILLALAAIAGSALFWRAQPQHAVLLASTADIRPGRGHCAYGAQPYFFEESGPITFDQPPAEWRAVSLDADCAPRQLIEPLLNASRRGEPSADRLVIMLFGDRQA